jgi:hypothetical protein
MSTTRNKTKIVLTALASALVLAGCDQSTNILGGGPQPQTTLAPEPPQPAPVRVAFAPIIGAPDTVARTVQQDLTAAAAPQRVSFVSANETTDLTLRGYFVAGRDRAGTKFSYIWDLTDTSGARVHRFAGDELGVALPQGQRDLWSALTPQLSQAIAQKSAASLTPVIVGRRPQGGAPGTPPVASAPAQPAAAPIATAGTVAPAAPAPQAPRVQPAAVGGAATQTLSALVPTVTGAPGDGSSSLATALRTELTRGGLPVAPNAPGAYRVEGVVRLGAAKADGNQPIQIDWHVKDQAGGRVGTVTQKNEVPQGSLDGQWGEAANAAASAAAQGILKLVREHSQRATN